MTRLLRTLHISGLSALLLTSSAALAETPPQPPGKPGDDRVRLDIWRDGKGMLDFKTTAGKGGEFEWDPRSRTWFFQRGFVVTREGGVAEFPQARLEVGGLAIYRWTGTAWAFQKELVTFNRYTGIPAPSDDDLLGLARQAEDRLLRQHRRDIVGAVQSARLSQDQLPRWHNVNAISFWLETQYQYRVPGNGSVVPCTTVSEVRTYRNNPQSPWRDTTGVNMKVLSGCGRSGK